MVITILGCGPAGLVAAKAAADYGHDVVIISKSTEPSTQYGCQYLHEPIPGYEGVPMVRVSYRLTGTPAQYRAKVYGSSWEGKVSPEDFIGEHMAWDIRETYRLLWRDLIESGRVKLREGRAADGLFPGIYIEEPDFIFSSVPAPVLCYQNHIFRGHSIWANGSTLADSLRPSSIMCDGTPDHDWYRISNVFGYRTTEWPQRPHNKYRRAVHVIKPLSTDCTCHPDFIRIGRYGTWAKAVLVHEVYPAVAAALQPDERLIRGIERVTGETYKDGKWRI